MRYTKINLMLPTYKRLKSLQRFLESALELAKSPDDLRFSFCVNNKDTDTQDYLEKLDFNGQAEVILENTRQPNLSKFYNSLYDDSKFRQPDTVVTMVGDDMEFKTDAWDTTVLEEVNKAEGKIVLHLNDNFIAHQQYVERGDCIPVNLFTTPAMVEPTGRPFMCPLFHAEMIDVVWGYIGEITQTKIYLTDVILQHHHNSAKPKEEWDETFCRLSPIQAMTNSKDSFAKAWAYATRSAAQLIDAGVGSWNVLN